MKEKNINGCDYKGTKNRHNENKIDRPVYTTVHCNDLNATLKKLVNLYKIKA